MGSAALTLCAIENLRFAQNSESSCERFSVRECFKSKVHSDHGDVTDTCLSKKVSPPHQRGFPCWWHEGAMKSSTMFFTEKKTKPWKPCSSVLQLCIATFKPSVFPQKETFFVLVYPDCSSMGSTAVKWRSPSPLSTWSAKRKRTCASNWRCAACYLANMHPYTNMHRQHLRRPLVVIFDNASAQRKFSFLWIESDSSHQ